jgi:hypothetical protein
MDKVIITIPDYVVVIVAIWFVMATIESILKIYEHYLIQKLRKRISKIDL